MKSMKKLKSMKKIFAALILVITALAVSAMTASAAAGNDALAMRRIMFSKAYSAEELEAAGIQVVKAQKEVKAVNSGNAANDQLKVKKVRAVNSGSAANDQLMMKDVKAANTGNDTNDQLLERAVAEASNLATTSGATSENAVPYFIYISCTSDNACGSSSPFGLYNAVNDIYNSTATTDGAHYTTASQDKMILDGPNREKLALDFSGVKVSQTYEAETASLFSSFGASIPQYCGTIASSASASCETTDNVSTPVYAAANADGVMQYIVIPAMFVVASDSSSLIRDTDMAIAKASATDTTSSDSSKTGWKLAGDWEYEATVDETKLNGKTFSLSETGMFTVKMITGEEKDKEYYGSFVLSYKSDSTVDGSSTTTEKSNITVDCKNGDGTTAYYTPGDTIVIMCSNANSTDTTTSITEIIKCTQVEENKITGKLYISVNSDDPQCVGSITAKRKSESNGGSSGGCNAGASAAMLLFCAIPMMFRKKK